MPAANDRALWRLVDIFKERYISQSGSSSARPERPRVVLVLGAGASIGSGLPLWSQPALKTEVLQIAERHFGVHPRFLNEAWAALGPTIGFPGARWTEDDKREKLKQRASLDQLCAVACGFHTLRGEILGLLRRKFAPWTTEERPEPGAGTGPPPQLGYELIAHLLKHRFIDHVITFNFDEVLDEAIRSELTDDDFVCVTSDHHVPATGNDKPHLIKLHGTLSQPETIRFTPDRTATLPEHMVEVLDRIIFHPARAAESQVIRLISLGYAWKDRDFAHYIAARSDLIREIVVVVRDPTDEADVLIGAPERLYPQARAAAGPRVLRLLLSASTLVPQGADVPSVDTLLWAVWRALFADLTGSAGPPVPGTPRYPVMPAARHVVLSHLFAGDSSACTREARFLAELFLHTVECKGMVNVSVMARNCRLHRHGPRPHAGRDPLLSGNLLRRANVADVKETYFAVAETPEMLCEWPVGRRDFAIPATVTEPDLDVEGHIEYRAAPAVGRVFLERQLKTVFDGEEVEVVPSRDPRHEWVFSEPEPMATYLEFQMATRELLEDGDWTVLLVIAETGAWLSSELFAEILRRQTQGGARRILCIETSTRDLGEWHLRKAIERELEQKRRSAHQIGTTLLTGRLAWWKHNRHLTLGYDGNGRQFTKGIYFRRRLKSTQISPVRVCQPQDCAELFLTFLSYARRVIEDIDGERAPEQRPRPQDELDQFQELLRALLEIASAAPIGALRVKCDRLLDRFRQYLQRR